VYRKALDKLREAPYQGLARSLNFLIVRGDQELMVLFNVHNMTAEVVRKAKMLAEHLMQDKATGVIAAHLFFDPSKSSYYLEAKGPVHAQRLKRLVGPEFLPIDVAGRRYFLHPLGFFQVNISILPRVLEEVQRGLKPGKTERLLDLYCGCGFFTLPLEEDCKEAVGVEFSPVSLDAAHMAAGRSRAKSVRFVAGKIETAKLHRLIPPVDDTPEILLLDPPVQGTAPGLIRALAERKPKRIAHLFCGMDVLPAEVKAWRKQGYMLAKAIPFDMFPGTDNLEVLVILIPDKYGILNRKKVKVDPVDEYEQTQAASHAGPGESIREERPAPATRSAHVKPVYRNGKKPTGKKHEGERGGKQGGGEERKSRKAPGRPRRKH
jgi:tRNA/tmRNA/rRNA uracil-C5-methylase (TrmA/RlmC/RlmD family)